MSKFGAVKQTIDGHTFASKECFVCGEVFHREGRQSTHWKRQRACSSECGKHLKRRPWEPRFWDKVTKAGPDECWLWAGGKDTGGYGLFDAKFAKLDGVSRNAKAHRVSYVIAFGPIPDGMVVMHKCDVPGCVNPRHLLAGSVADNNRDRDQKGRTRHPRGEACSRAVLTADLVVRARASVSSGSQTVAEIARCEGVAYHAVWNAVHGRSWGHIQ